MTRGIKDRAAAERRLWGEVERHQIGMLGPNLTMLRLDRHDAQAWISKGDPVKIAWEVAKAKLTDAT